MNGIIFGGKRKIKVLDQFISIKIRAILFEGGLSVHINFIGGCRGGGDGNFNIHIKVWVTLGTYLFNSG